MRKYLQHQLVQLKSILDYQIEDDLGQLFENLNINQFTKQSKTEKNEIKELEAGLEQLPEKWNLIYQYFFNEIKLDNALGKVRIRLFQILQWFNNEINKASSELIDNKIAQLKKDITSTIKSLNAKEKPSEVFNHNEPVTHEQLIVYEKKAERCIQIINNLIKNVPDKINLLDDIVFNDLKIEDIEDSKSYSILSSRLIEGIISNDIKSLFHQLVSNLEKEISEIDNEIVNQNRLIRYTIFKDEETQTEHPKDDELTISTFLESRLDEVQKLTDNLVKTNDKAFNQLLEGYFAVNDKLQLYAFKREANSWNQYLPTTAISSISTVKRVVSSVGNFIDRQIDEFWYRQSDAILLAEDLSASDSEHNTTSVFKLLNISEEASISKKVLGELPFFYQHLFLDKNYFNNDFWVGREDETQRALLAYRRFSEGFPGALLIKGERNTGKSFIIRHLCTTKIKPGKVIYINAPEQNVNEPKHFLKHIQSQIGQKGSVEKMMNSLGEDTVMVFEDIELWWEKAENGNHSLTQLFELVEKYSNKIFFILSINSYSYNIISKMLNIEPFLLDKIHCKPMNSRKLQETILFRHRASGLKFSLEKHSAINGKTDEEDFKSKQFAVLFSKYFNYSKGNIGACLLGWMANIISISDNRILIKSPKQINTSEVEKLDNEQIIYLYQLVLHKRMDISKMARVMMSTHETVQKKMDFLLRSGLILKTDTYYEINAYLHNAIITVLKNKDII